MNIEILSVDNELDLNKEEELKKKLGEHSFDLTSVKSVACKPNKIKAALNLSAKQESKPDAVLVIGALSKKDSSSFRKLFAESVAQAEHEENKPADKAYWKERQAAFKDAKKYKVDQEELDRLTEEYKLTRKKMKIFDLGDFGNGYKGYCFMFKGIKVGVLPKEMLTEKSSEDMTLLAMLRINDVFEKSCEEYPDGFSCTKYLPKKDNFATRFIPMKGDSGKEISRKCVVIVSFLVFLTALSLLLYNTVFLSVRNTQLNGEIQKIAHIQPKETGDKKPAVEDEIDWKKLAKINKEIVGWIQIKDTKIDYPVLWHKDDNREYQYYLSHNYKGDFDSYGSVFLDYRCTKGIKSKNTVMHGHHMNDGSMFGALLKYGSTSGNLDFYKKAPIIEFDTPDKKGTYKIISVFKTNTISSQGEFFNYMIGNFQNEKDFMNYVYNVRIRSLINCPVDVNEDDELITLSTCSYEFTNFRTVVVARRVRKDESVKVDTSQASLNRNAVWPDVYYSAYGGSRPKVTDFCTAYDAKQIDWYDGDYDFKDQKIKPAATEKSKDDKSKNNSNSQSAKTYCTVVFLDYDGSVLSSQQVEYGKAAKAPDKKPTKPSDEYYDYEFKEWGLKFDKVIYNMEIAPKFEPKLKPQYQNGE